MVTARDAVLTEGKRGLIDHATRFDGVRVLGVLRTCGGTPVRLYVTFIIDLTAIHDWTGPARLLDLAEGRS